MCPSAKAYGPDFQGITSFCIAAVCSLALLALVATIARWFHPGLPARVRFTENAVQALDAEGRRLCPGLRSNQPRLPRHYWDSDPTEGARESRLPVRHPPRGHRCGQSRPVRGPLA